ncbi:MAG: hypothetical protein JRJ85_03890 [Deltaproteobacteria bacterium]|nr:hypothetical protein [Deltaproteobacteria bacterium]
MPDTLQITMLPAKEGDCLVITWGRTSDKKYILVDGGRAWTYENALKRYLRDRGITEIELLVVTHVDRDHIDGMLKLIKDSNLNLMVRNIWFNTWDHLRGLKIENPEAEDDIEEFGAKMGEELSTEIISKSWRWNSCFDGQAVELRDDPGGNIIRIADMKLTLLSPDRDKLEALIPKWKKECQKAGITPGFTVKDYIIADDDLEDFGAVDIDALADEEFSNDHSDANGSSIAFILEYKNRKALLSGDAHPDLLVKSLTHLGVSKEDPLALDAFKVPHHGSKYNISKDLLSLMKCDHYLISTNGNFFDHPDDVAMARLMKYGTDDSTLSFNYKTDRTSIWEEVHWQRDYKYKTNYPPQGQDGYLSLEFRTGS